MQISELTLAKKLTLALWTLLLMGGCLELGTSDSGTDVDNTTGTTASTDDYTDTAVDLESFDTDTLYSEQFSDDLTDETVSFDNEEPQFGEDAFYEAYDLDSHRDSEVAAYKSQEEADAAETAETFEGEVTMIFGKQPPLKFRDLNSSLGSSEKNELADLNVTSFDITVTPNTDGGVSFDDNFWYAQLEDHDTAPTLNDTGEITALYKVVPAHDILITDVATATIDPEAEACTITTEVSQEELSFEASLKAEEDPAEADEADEDAEGTEEDESTTYDYTLSQEDFSLFDADSGELNLADGGPYVEADVTGDGDRIAYVPVKKDANHYLLNAHCFKRPAALEDRAGKPSLGCFGQLVGELADGTWGVVGAIRLLLGKSADDFAVVRAEAIDNDGVTLFHLRTLKPEEDSIGISDFYETIEEGEIEGANNIVPGFAQVLNESDYEDDLSAPTNPTGHGIAKLVIKAPAVEGAIGKRAFGINGIIQTVNEEVDLEALLTSAQE